MGRNIKTNKQKEESKRLSIEHNKLRWIYISKNFQCEQFTLFGPSWFELVATWKDNGKWFHRIKKRDSSERFEITNRDLNEMKRENKEKNPHLF